MCEVCNKGFLTKTRLDVHIKSMHPSDAEEIIVTKRVKLRWPDEEVRRMATAEAHAIYFSLDVNINQYLQGKLFEERTVESVEDKRGEDAY